MAQAATEKQFCLDKHVPPWCEFDLTTRRGHTVPWQRVHVSCVTALNARVQKMCLVKASKGAVGSCDVFGQSFN